ncbi:hypothetical protein AKJ16_DCAP11256 [Drosera capensis]
MVSLSRMIISVVAHYGAVRSLMVIMCINVMASGLSEIIQSNDRNILQQWSSFVMYLVPCYSCLWMGWDRDIVPNSDWNFFIGSRPHELRFRLTEPPIWTVLNQSPSVESARSN